MSHHKSMTKAKNILSLRIISRVLFFFVKPPNYSGHTAIYNPTIKKDPNEWKAWPVQLRILSLLIVTMNISWMAERIVAQAFCRDSSTDLWLCHLWTWSTFFFNVYISSIYTNFRQDFSECVACSLCVSKEQMVPGSYDFGNTWLKKVEWLHCKTSQSL